MAVRVKRCISFLGVIAIAFTMSGLSMPSYADELSDLSAEVERTSAALDTAKTERDNIKSEIEKLTDEISQYESIIPDLTKKADDAAIALYKDGNTSDGFMQIILSAESITDMLAITHDYEVILDSRIEDISRAKAAKQKLEEDKYLLNTDLMRSEEAVRQADEALASAIKAREEAQQAAAAREAAEKAEASGSALAAEIDWTLPEATFISSWGARIDAYLSGTPLSGYGVNFATAAYKYGIDPRWSAAISRIESSCGAACFRPHNAWGWMGKSFDSWEEAIDAHAGYLAGPLYGGYITPEGAATYCPPGGPWYDAVSKEMRKI